MSQQIKTVNIRGKNYVEVAERVRLVHDQKREFEVIESEPYPVSDRWLWRVTVKVDGKNYKGNAEVKMNAPKNSPDGTNPFECAETSAIGRALAYAGFGSVESIASFDEVYRAMTSQSSQPSITPVQQAQETHALATGQQRSSIDKLCQHLERAPLGSPELTYEQARELIQKLTAEYRDVQDMKRQPMRALPVQDRALIEMIAKAKARCGTLQILWEDAKTDADLARTEDEELTVQQVAHINQVLKQYQEKLVPAK